MNEAEVYSENQRIFDSGIASDMNKNPYKLTRAELDCLETELKSYSELFGEPAVLVAWGQPYMALEPERSYHPASEIERLRDFYVQFNLKGICPKAKASFGFEWIGEQKKRLEKIPACQPEILDLEAHVKSFQNTQF